MSAENLARIILAPCVSEKATKVQIDRQYVFQVRVDADKGSIARAVKAMFDVDVDSVRVCNVQGKRRKFKNINGKRKDWKKAYVTVKEGQAINFGGV